MYKLFYFLVLFVWYLSPNLGAAQVVMQSYLRIDHSGALPESINFPDKGLEYQFTYQDHPSAVKCSYTLNLSSDGKEINTFDVRLRNLDFTFYLEIRMQGPETALKTLSAIFDKSNKWLRVKFAAPPGCSAEDEQWDRVNNISDFQELLLQVITQLDRNVQLTCYQKSG
ncbi:MAG: hypothetical protein AAF502_15700 [Bacteroidota bacterium]